MKFIQSIVLACCMVLISSSAWAKVTNLGSGVFADITQDDIKPSLTVTDIVNKTGYTAYDFHIYFSQGGQVLQSFNFSTHPGSNDTPMDNPIGNGSTLKIGGQTVSVTFSGNVGTVDAYWTDKDGKIITPIPEPETMSLLLIGLATTGLALRRRKASS